MKNESKSRTAEPDLPSVLIPHISYHPVDDLSDVLGSIDKRLEFIKAKLETTGGSLDDQLKCMNETGVLLVETFQMLKAYLDFVGVPHKDDRAS